MKELSIFDLDGTLLDSLSFTITLFNKLLHDLKLPTYDKDESEYDYVEFRNHLFKHLDFHDSAHVKRFLEIYHEEMLSRDFSKALTSSIFQATEREFPTSPMPTGSMKSLKRRI